MRKAKGDKGWHMTPNCLSRSGKDLSCIAYRVYGVIASYNPSHPSYTRIQEDSGLSRDSVRAGILELSQYNIISILKKGTAYGQTNEYFINAPDKWNQASPQSKLVDNTDQSAVSTTPSLPGELVDDVDWSADQTDPSTPGRPALVRKTDCNNTNIIIPNKKTNTAKADSGGSNGHTPTTPTQADPPSNGVHFDFEALYALFPKRGKDMKKSLGMQKCQAQIKTQEQYEKLKSAVLNYDEHIKSEKRKRFDYDITFIKTWGHFMSKTYWVD